MKISIDKQWDIIWLLKKRKSYDLQNMNETGRHHDNKPKRSTV
jgi:hypothetical protein